jgi:thioredoxin reductase (NADPH)
MIGAGPTGLFAGFPKILAKDLVKGMAEQALQWKAPVHLNEKVVGLRREQENGTPVFVVVTDRAEYPSRTVLVAGGIGAFTPRKLPLKDADRWYGKGLYDRVLNPKEFAGRRVLLVGGGDSAFDWAVNLQPLAKRILMIHRRDGFRAHHATVAQVQALCAAGKMELRTFWELKAIQGGDHVERVTILSSKTKEEEVVEVDCVLPQLGFVSSLGAIAEWGLDIEKGEIKVSQVMETNVPGIFAAGDITTYPGKLKLIATGVSEACIAVNNAVHYINPKAKVSPGHSSNLAIFGQKDD